MFITIKRYYTYLYGHSFLKAVYNHLFKVASMIKIFLKGETRQQVVPGNK